MDNYKYNEYGVILRWITKAKECYLNHNSLNHGMCKAFKIAIRKYPDLESELTHILKSRGSIVWMYEGIIMYDSKWVRELIPEFNFYFLGGDTSTPAYESYRTGDIAIGDIYWWNRDDKESRLNAFDKLIGIYKAKVNGGAL